MRPDRDTDLTPEKGTRSQDDAAIIARVNARLSGIERHVPHPRPWQPPASHSVRRARTERGIRMSWSASLTAASVALVALGASFLVSTAPGQPVGVGSDPGAVAASASPAASIIPAGDLAVAVVGTGTWLGYAPGEGGSEGVTADSIAWGREGEGYTRHTLRMSDPRLSGTLKQYANWDDFGWPDRVDSGLELMWGTFHIENEGGAWEGPYRGATVWDVEKLATPPPSFYDVALRASMNWTWDAWLEGSGDYEGLSAWIRIDVKDGAHTSPVVGLIFPGPLPPDR